MQLLLASNFNNSKKDDNGNRIAVALPDVNDFLSNIKKRIKKYDNVLFVVSNPSDFANNDFYGDLFFSALDLSGLQFKQKVILDGRNEDKARDLVNDSDIIFIAGGNTGQQNEFFKRINLQKHLSGYANLIVGASAGAMNLCNIVAILPDDMQNINIGDSDTYFTSGMGFFDRIIIPHFNGKESKYKRGGADAFEALLQLSNNEEFIAFNDDSYLLVDDNQIRCCGDIYKITKGVSVRVDSLD